MAFVDGAGITAPLQRRCMVFITELDCALTLSFVALTITSTLKTLQVALTV